MLYTKEHLGMTDNLIFINKEIVTQKKKELPHSHEFIEIEYVFQGSGTQVIDGKEHSAEKGDLFIFDMGDVHFYKTDGYMEIFNCVFLPSALSEEPNANISWKKLISADESYHKFPMILHFDGEEAVQLDRLFLTMHEQFMRKKTNHRTLLKTALQLLFELIEQKFHQSSGIATSFLAVLNKINVAFDRNDDYSLHKTASDLQYNASYFSKYFKKNCGMTYSEYIMRKRCDKAMNLIMHSSDTIESICFQSGFSDKKQFYKSFKQYVGTTPNQLRKKKP